MLENTSILNIGGQDTYLEDEYGRKMITDVYSQKTYNTSDLCIKDNMLYQCLEDITEPEPFNIAKWKPTNLTEVMTGNRLSTKEEVSANTQPCKVADALVTKEMIADVAQLNQSLGNITNNIYAIRRRVSGTKNLEFKTKFDSNTESSGSRRQTVLIIGNANLFNILSIITVAGNGNSSVTNLTQNEITASLDSQGFCKIVLPSYASDYFLIISPEPIS